MLQISVKKVVAIVLLIIFIIVFLVTLLISNHRENKELEKSNKRLTIQLVEAQKEYKRLVIARHNLLNVVEDATSRIVSQTNTIKYLTKRFSNINYSLIVIRDTIPCEEDALAPYSSSRDSTKSRGF